MSKPVASRGTPARGNNDGITDHASAYARRYGETQAERNAGSGQARSVTPLAARSVPDADGVERSGTGAYTASRASGERRTAEERDDDHAARDTRASRDSGERGAVHVPTLAQDLDRLHHAER